MMGMMVPSAGFLLVIIGISFILINAGPVRDPDCPPNVSEDQCRECTGNRTIYCHGICPDACNKPPQACEEICIIGCACKPEYVLLSDDDETQCVLPKDCPPLKRT